MCVRAAVKTAVEKEQSRELERCTGAFRCDRSDMREKKFPSHPLLTLGRLCAMVTIHIVIDVAKKH